MNTRTAEKRPLGALGRMVFVGGMHAALLLVLARSFGLMPPPALVKTEAVVIDERAPSRNYRRRCHPDDPSTSSRMSFSCRARCARSKPRAIRSRRSRCPRARNL